MIFRIRFPTESNILKISLPKKVFTMVRKRGVAQAADSSLLGFTRHLNMECFESAVPTNFVSYAPTFKFHPWTMRNCITEPLT